MIDQYGNRTPNNFEPQQQDPEVAQLIQQVNKPTLKERFKTGIKKVFSKTNQRPPQTRKIKIPINYRKQLSSNLQRQFTPQNQIRKAPSPKQLLARQRFAQMVRQNAMLRKQVTETNRSLPSGRGNQPPALTNPQFRKPEARGVWRANLNNGMGSKVPSNLRKYGRRTFFIEADILGNPVVRMAGDSSSFFN